MRGPLRAAIRERRTACIVAAVGIVHRDGRRQAAGRRCKPQAAARSVDARRSARALAALSARRVRAVRGAAAGAPRGAARRKSPTQIRSRNPQPRSVRRCGAGRSTCSASSAARSRCRRACSSTRWRRRACRAECERRSPPAAATGPAARAAADREPTAPPADTVAVSELEGPDDQEPSVGARCSPGATPEVTGLALKRAGRLLLRQLPLGQQADRGGRPDDAVGRPPAQPVEPRGPDAARGRAAARAAGGRGERPRCGRSTTRWSTKWRSSAATCSSARGAT